MKSILSILFICALWCSKGMAQNNFISTATTMGYSGISQSIRYARTSEKWSIALGPKFSFNQSRNLIGNAPGISFQTDFHPDCKGKYFLLYEFLPFKVNLGKAQIHEAYVGYGYRWKIGEKWLINSGIGVGMYIEKGEIIQSYQLKGLSYCSNIAFGYFF